MRKKLILTLVIQVMVAAPPAFAAQTEQNPKCGIKTGVYLQEDPMAKAYSTGQLAGIVAKRGSGLPIEVELNLRGKHSLPQWKQMWNSASVVPTENNVIIDFVRDRGWVDAFKQFVIAGKSVGIMTTAPIFSPNNKSFPLNSFSKNDAYSEIRQAALLGGGLVLDAPPGYFFKQGHDYQEFTYKQIRWATAHHLRSTAIVSPYGDDAYFLNNVRKYVRLFVANGAIPSEWAVENYNASDGNGEACERTPHSIAGVTAWIAEYGPRGTGGAAEKRMLKNSKTLYKVLAYQGIAGKE